MKKKVFVVAALLGSVVALLACSDDHHHGSSGTSGGHTSPYVSCQQIIDRCHPLDVGEGAIHDCHEVAHEASSEEACAAKKDECFRACVPAADGGSTEAGSEGGAHDASADGNGHGH